MIEREVYEDNIIDDVTYVEKIVNVPVEKLIERPVLKENIIDRPKFIDRIIEKEVIVPIEKIIEVPVEKVVEVPVDVIVENPVMVQKFTEKKIYVDKKINKPIT